MNKNILSNAAGKTSGILGMKTLFILLCASSALQSTSLHGIENETEEDIPMDANPSEEIGAFDASSLIQKPMSSQEIQLPVPALDLRPPRNTFFAVGLSSLLPGLGHVYLGDMKTAGGLIGGTGVGIGCASFLHSKIPRGTSLLIVQNIWAYGIYAAYRDVRINNGQSGYSYQMPTDSFADLTSAPFRWSVLKKPEVWGGLLGKFALIGVVSYLSLPKETHAHSSRSLKRRVSPLVAFPVGVGEEALFRGFLQSQLSEFFNPWVSITLSSLAFGAVHITNARDFEPEKQRYYYTHAIPIITAAGAYYGWLAYKNHSLKESVALHTWYDFILLTVGSLVGQAAITGCSKFSFTVPF